LRRLVVVTAVASVAAAFLPVKAQAQTPTPVQAPASPAPTQPVPPQAGVGAAAGTVREIRIEGTQRIEPDTVRSYLLIQPGDPFNDERADRSLKALFATGLFADVTLRRDGDALVVRVVENPIINRVAFEGNKKYDDAALSAELQLRPRIVYTRTKVQADVKRILDLYRRSGRFAATVDPKVIPLDQNRVDLVFEIDEGPVTGISAINFIGNKQFSASRLLEIINTKESRWYRFLSTADTYDPDRITFDRELLRKFYLSQGYADFRVVSAVAELTPARDGFFVTFTLEEGERYHFGKIDVVSQIKALQGDDLKPLVTVQEGDWYNADEVEKTITKLTEALGNRGFAFVDIRPDVNRNREARTIDVTFQIQEGPRVYVERIDIVGNVRTLDSVVRREFRLVEGDAFNTSKLRRSEQRIRSLGFFKKVDVTNAQGSAPDKTVITVNVEEQSTGEISVGGGISTTDGLLGNITLRERNLLGRGQDLRVGFGLSQRTQNVDLSFTEPYFLGRNLAAGFDLYQIDQKNQINAVFDQFTLGGALRMGYQLTENLRQTLNYTLRTDSINNVQSTASLFIQQQAGTRLTSSVGQVLIYDRRDSTTDPSEGYFVSLGNDLAGIGGQVDYIRTKVQSAYYYPLAPEWVVTVSGEGGAIKGLAGQIVRIEDRFFIGGENVRGFATSGMGPRDATTGDALGGNDYYAASLQLGFPLGLPQELGLTGRVFTDVGSAFGIDQQTVTFNGATSTVESSAAPRMSVGTGLTWKSPFGPIRVDLGVPVIKKQFDKSEFFRFGFGTRF
jgi:outer membrane protein insertion porin family